MPAITRGSVNGVLVTGLIRVLHFLAVLGVVAGGVALSKTDPAGSVFRAAAGQSGFQLFGPVFWKAGMTSTIGASFISVSFLKLRSKRVGRHDGIWISTSITIATVAYLALGTTPKSLLIFAGSPNGLILPFGLPLVLRIAWRRRDLLAGYAYPKPLLVFGVLAWAFTVYAGTKSLATLPTILQ